MVLTYRLISSRDKITNSDFHDMDYGFGDNKWEVVRCKGLLTPEKISQMANDLTALVKKADPSLSMKPLRLPFPPPWMDLKCVHVKKEVEVSE